MPLRKIPTGTLGEMELKNKMPNTYHTIIGMEVHAELKTATKMFCGCKNDPFFAPQPNIYTCPVCLGMPGGLPVANKKAIEWTIKLGLALGCQVNLFSHFDRKNYFYPDLAKGYQISQYDQPLCFDGKIETSFGDVRIRRIHLEEDTGKLQHTTIDGKKVSLIDFNRGGVPLIEIVTEPDIHSPEQAKEYAKKLRQILRFLNIADCDMEQGGMRLEANLSLSSDPKVLPNYKVELKNINSFRFLEKAIQFEERRHAELLSANQTPVQETRGWNDNKGETFSQRTKEDAEDYRYFPDPDLPPIRFTQLDIEKMRATLPELPSKMISRWQDQYGIEPKNSELLTEDKDKADWAEAIFKLAEKPNEVAKAIVNKKIIVKFSETAAEVIALYQQATQTDSVDETELKTTVETIISENPDAVVQYKAGKTQVLGFFFGQAQRKLGKKVDSQQLRSLFEEALRA